MKSKGFEYPKVKVDANMRDYSRDPYFLKKDEEAREFIERVGFPADLVKLQAERMKE